MNRRLSYPRVDERRARLLREALLRDMTSLAPHWRAVHEASGPDRALVEIAARFLEKTTERLDKTPQRDALAFLDFYDVPAPQPRSAKGFAVLTLSEDASGSQTISPRTPLDIPSGDGDPVRFETEEAVPLHAARIAYLGSVDPSSDEICVAPAAATAFERDDTAPTRYRLAASADADDRVIRLEYATGIEAGDLLRITHPETQESRIKSVLEVAADGLITLAEPIGAAGLDIAQNEIIERMTWLDAFDMPNEQEHALYLGDDALFDLKEPARFKLHFDGLSPGPGGSRDTMVVELYGLRDFKENPDTEPAWHRLPLTSVNGDEFTYLKAWPGPVIPVEISPEFESRWLRLRRIGPILPSKNTDPRKSDLSVVQITLQVETDEPDLSEGSLAVSQAVHNSTPLPVTSAFLPFGPEPQRFDVFALSAPETFSKHEALATLKFDLVDATLKSLSGSMRADNQRRLFGVGGNGRLQVLEIEPDEDLFWRETEGPVSDDLVLKLTSDAPQYAGQISQSSDLVAVCAVKLDDDLQLYTARVRRVTDDEDVVADNWDGIPKPSSATDWRNTRALGIMPFLHDEAKAQLLFADKDGVHRLRYRSNGSRIDGSWQTLALPAGLVVDETARVLPIPGSFAENTGDPREGDVLLTDVNDDVWLLRFIDGQPHWHKLEDSNSETLNCAANTLPTALSWKDGTPTPFLSIAVIKPNGDFKFVTFDDNFPPAPLGAPFSQPAPNDARLAIISGNVLPEAVAADQVNRPSLLVVSTSETEPKITEWPMGSDPRANHLPIPRALPIELGKNIPVVSFPSFNYEIGNPPTKVTEPAILVAPGRNETLLRMEMVPARKFSLFSWIPTGTNPDLNERILLFVEDHPSGSRERISEPKSLAKSATGNTWYVGALEPVDATADMTLLHTTEEWSVALEMDGSIPKLRYHKDDITLPDLPINLSIIAIKTAVSAAKEFARFQVATVENDGGDRLLLVDAADEAALIDFETSSTDPLSLRAYVTVSAAHDVVAAGSVANYGTLAITSGGNDALTGIAMPDDISQIVASIPPELITGLGNVSAALLPAWPGNPPEIIWSKATSNKFETQSLLAVPLDKDFQGPELSWEYYDGEAWQRLDRDFDDNTGNLVRSGDVSFRIPDDLSKVDIAGQEDLWVRARLIGGDYGRPRYVVGTEFEDGNPVKQTVNVDASHMRPPEVAAIGSSFGPTPKAPPELVIARNNGRDIDQAGANRLITASYPVFEGVNETPLATPNNKRALMLGLSQPIPPGLVTLFARVADQEIGTEITIETLRPDLSWVKAPLVGDDPTKGLVRSGLIRFNIKSPMAPANLLGQSLCWLRIVGHAEAWSPLVQGLWLNGTPIVQAETVIQELLGTSLGEPSTRFQLLKSPVVENSLELRVRERLGSEEIERLRANHVDGEPNPVLEDVENIPGQWVLWQQTDTLRNQGNVRKYLLAPDGTVQFGDGKDGRIPPAIRDGIRAFSYQAGGKPVDTAAFAEISPKVQIPQFDLAFAPEAIAGGSDFASSERLLSRAPVTLRHQSHALSLADIEAIACDFDNQIVHVRALSPENNNGPIQVAVLAKGEGRAPVYSLSRCEALSRALVHQMSDAFSSTCLSVKSVTYRDLIVHVSLVADAGQGMTLGATVGTLLEDFLNPTTGGVCGDGWPPGRMPVPIDLERVLTGAKGLQSINEISVSLKDQDSQPTLSPSEVIVVRERVDLNVAVFEEDKE